MVTWLSLLVSGRTLMRRNHFLLVLILAFGHTLQAQKVTNIRATQIESELVRISYDLQEEVPGQLFTVQLFSSANDFNLPLVYVQGEVGENIKAGIDKFIDWDISKELIAFDGDLTFEVRALLTFSPVKLSYPVKGSISRGKTHTITWEGNNPNEDVDIELFRDRKKIGTIAKTTNDGSFEWDVPVTLKPGRGYSLKISSTSSTQFDRGGKFNIRRRVPLLVKVVPLAAIVPAIIILSDGGGSTGPRILPTPPNNPD